MMLRYLDSSSPKGVFASSYLPIKICRMKQSKKLVVAQQRAEDRRFNRRLALSFSLIFFCIVLILVFFTYWCDTRYAYRMYSLYGKRVPPTMACFAENILREHETQLLKTSKGAVYVCSMHCRVWIGRNLERAVYAEDAFSHEPLVKSSSIIGLQKRGEPQLVYFKNDRNFKRYYGANDRTQVINKTIDQ